jgi:23S rRNA (uridine2552-2'-O)-methyltransferase
MKKLHDFYFKKAKNENHAARSIYKLEEMDKKYKIIKNGMSIIDLGCAPGSWIEYAVKKVGKNGSVFGIDLNKVHQSFPSNVTLMQGDIFDFDAMKANIKQSELLPEKFDLVMSDMAPNTTGQKDVDAYKSYELCVQALKVADAFLKKRGDFIVKIFMGEDFKAFLDTVKASFSKHKVYKPKSSRKESKETYIIGFGKEEIDYSNLT